MTKFNKKSEIGGLRTTRKVGEKIIINNGELIIEITEIRGSRVKLSILADKEISIKRFETVRPPAKT